MNGRNRQIPRPSFDEDRLLREAAPVPELSAGFRSRVLSDCVSSVAASRRAFRMKVAGSVAAVCCLSLLFAVTLPRGSNGPGASATHVQASPASTVNPVEYSPASSPSLAVDKGVGRGGGDSTQMNELIEDLTDRQKIFDANVMPRF